MSSQKAVRGQVDKESFTYKDWVTIYVKPLSIGKFEGFVPVILISPDDLEAMVRGAYDEGFPVYTWSKAALDEMWLNSQSKAALDRVGGGV